MKLGWLTQSPKVRNSAAGGKYLSIWNPVKEVMWHAMRFFVAFDRAFFGIILSRAASSAIYNTSIKASS